MRTLVAVFLLILGPTVVAGPDGLAAEIEFVNAVRGSFETSDGCDQQFIAWVRHPLSEPSPNYKTSTSHYVLVVFTPSDPGQCITEEQARSGVLLTVVLTPEPTCNAHGDSTGTWGYAEQECIDRKGMASDCWEERSDYLPLNQSGLSLKEIEQMDYFECYRLAANPFRKADPGPSP